MDYGCEYSRRRIMLEPSNDRPAMVVTSTARNAWEFAEQCIRSVKEQEGSHHSHVYFACDERTAAVAEKAAELPGNGPTWIADGSGNPVLGNLVPLWRRLPPETIIVWLDGDDWLATDFALASVADVYLNGNVWATYGQYIFRDGTPGMAYRIDSDYRKASYGHSHLKTFKAGLIQHIRDSDFRMPDGSYSSVNNDGRVMWAIAEMAEERCVFIDKILYVYNLQHSFAANETPAAKEAEWQETVRVQNFPPYSRLEKI